MPRRMMAFVTVALVAIVAMWIAPDVSNGAPTGAVHAPNAMVAAASPVAGTPVGTPDLGVELPAAIDLHLLASADVDGLPSGRTNVRLERIVLEANRDLFAGGDATQLLVIESGAVLVSGGELSGRFDAGAQIVAPSGASIHIRSAGSTPATLLRLTLIAVNAANTGNGATPGATPVAESISPVVLFDGEATRLPDRRATLTIVRGTLPPGVETKGQSFDGPVALIVESGSIAFNGLSEAPLQIDAGGWVFVPAFTSASATNPGDTPTTVLLVGVFPIRQAVATISTPTPTTGPNVVATARAESDNAQSTTEARRVEVQNLQATVSAQASAIASAESARATAESRATQAGDNAEVARASREADASEAAATISALETAGAASESALATAEAARDTAFSNLARLATSEAALSRTVTAQLTEIANTAAGAETAQAAAQATITALSATSEAYIEAASDETDTLRATANANASSAAATVLAAQATIVGLETAEADLQATIAALNATATAAVAAANAATDDARATASADASSAAATRGAVQTSVAILETTEANLQATITAQNSALSAAATAQTTSAANAAAVQSTADALGTSFAETQSALGSAEAAAATVEAAATADAEHARATIEALGTAESDAAANAAATIEALGTAGADSAATAQADVDALGTAGAAAASAAQATIDAQGTAGADAASAAAATESARETAAANQASTAAADASAADATTQALLGGQEALVATISAQSTNAANLATSATAAASSAAATIAAQATQAAESANQITGAINPEYVELSIQVDLQGVLADNDAANTQALAAIRDALQRYTSASCRAGVVLTFGHGSTIGIGTQLAAAINDMIQAQYPGAFGAAAFDSFGDLRAPLGQVDIRIYFFSGCGPAEEG